MNSLNSVIAIIGAVKTAIDKDRAEVNNPHLERVSNELKKLSDSCQAVELSTDTPNLDLLAKQFSEPKIDQPQILASGTKSTLAEEKAKSELARQEMFADLAKLQEKANGATSKNVAVENKQAPAPTAEEGQTTPELPKIETDLSENSSEKKETQDELPEHNEAVVKFSESLASVSTKEGLDELAKVGKLSVATLVAYCKSNDIALADKPTKSQILEAIWNKVSPK